MHKPLAVFFIALALLGTVRAEDEGPPDITKGEMKGVNRNSTYNLGATGLRGWIYTKPTTYLDSLQGRTTARSRQIWVTHVGAKSPADGVIEVGDVILGAGGKIFTDDARKSIAFAIQEAETEARKGVLKLTRWRAGKTAEVTMTLRVMGTYSATAPYDCPKSKRIFDDACAVLAKEPLQESVMGAISGLALLATGKQEYMPQIRTLAHKFAPPTLKLELRDGGYVWDWGYRAIFLSEYYLITGDKDVLHGLQEYTVTLSKGQSMYGTFGHGISKLTPEGKLHGSIPPYGPVNMAGLAGNLGIVLGQKCGIDDPEVAPAVERASKFFGYYTDKGAIPYGEHEPWPYHENNGKNSMTAVMFAVQGNHVKDAQFFAKMATAGYASRECGHTGQGFSYLWGAVGANVGGPKALAAFFKEASWHFDLVRRCDGSMTYDGGEQYGPGKTDDDTYYGKSGYDGLSPAATYVLTYSLPLKKLLITGREAKTADELSSREVTDAIASGRFDLERTKKSAKELIAAFDDWSPIVRGWAAEELSKRPEAQSLVPQLVTLAGGSDVHAAQGACEALGYLKSDAALPVLVRLLSHEDRWLRYKAAQALRKMGGAAKPAVPGILKAIVATAEPLQPINWADPVQLTHGQLAAALFQGSMTDALKNADPLLLYPAIRAIAQNADGMARATLKGFFEQRLTLKDMEVLAPDIVAAVKTRCPADTMFGNEIRMGGFKALVKFHYKEGIAAGVEFAKTQGGHGSETRTAQIMKELIGYGSAAHEAIPALKELIDELNDQVKRREFPGGDFNKRRTTPVEEAIKAIEAATTHPDLRSIGTPEPAKPKGK